MLRGNGSGGLVESSYEGISVLPQFTYVTMSPSGVSVLDYPVREQFFSPGVDYELSIAVAQEEIAQNVEALAAADHARKVAHLTGGIDSRLVLAAILSTGHSGEFVFFCSGGPEEPDQKVARQLAKFGIRTALHGALRSRGDQGP